jgi:hypothetical protein
MGLIVDKVRLNRINNNILDEDNQKTINNKQRTVYMLFPDFDDKVDGVRKKGGIRLVDSSKNIWEFEAFSGTKSGVKYNIIIEFTNIEDMIEKYGSDRSYWKKDGSGIDLVKLSSKIFDSIEIRISCTCEAFLYWGFDYITTSRDSKYGKKEYRSPKVRNPKRYGIICKHLQVVFNQLPYYTSTFGSYLKKFYKDELEEVEKNNKE